MNDNIERTLEGIHESALVISACAESLEYIQKDLEELEMMANMERRDRSHGLVNIVEQLVNLIKSEAETVMELSEMI